LVREVYGGEIDLDPASCDIAQQVVKANVYFTKEQDGLRQPWHGNLFLNPPYRHPDIEHFVDKLLAELEAGRVPQAMLLVHNYTETDWFQKVAKSCSAMCFPDGRIPFTDPTGEPCNPRQGQTILYFGNLPLQFKAVFETIGFVVTLSENQCRMEAALALIRAMTADELARFDEAYASELRANAKAGLRMAS
jgi:hypothetical protein